jgi:hypothetical protein
MDANQDIWLTKKNFFRATYDNPEINTYVFLRLVGKVL